MQTVRLMGDLGDRFGEVWEVNVTSVAEIFKLIGCNTVGLQQYLIDCTENGVDFTVIGTICLNSKMMESQNVLS